jgi:D-beta-D-heptose 7-phosphate kinase/D-beta-D-heptose 1-phosphate adenosyltransferase
LTKLTGRHLQPRPQIRQGAGFDKDVSNVSLLDTFQRIDRPRILVLGDLMLDRYTWGKANRTSQEAPVLVLTVENRDHRPGGAANVGLMLSVLRAQVTCVGVVGDDPAGSCVRKLLDDAGVGTSSIHVAFQRPTTLKERFVGRSGSGVPSQILRVDTEVTTAIDAATESRLCAELDEHLPGQDAVLISDYDKGVCTPGLVAMAIRLANDCRIPVLVDPGRGREFGLYRQATLIKPNRTETEMFTGQRIESRGDAIRAGAMMCQQLDLAMAVITLDADGIALVHHSGAGKVFPTKARSVYDITGAGDMVLAMLGLAIAAGIDAESAVSLANAAAGLEVDRTGVAPLTRDEIRAELQIHQLNSRRKISDVDQAARWCEEYRRRGKRVVMTNGCFDLLHVGHASYLEEAAALGDVLIVAINSDDSVRRLKGPERPVIGQNERAALLAALGCVDHVVIFGDDTPHALLRELRPDILVKGGTYLPHQVIGREVVEAYGGRVSVVGMVQGVSTSQIVQNVLQGRALRQAG